MTDAQKANTRVWFAKNAPLFFILHSNNNGFIPTGRRSRTRSLALQFSISDRADEALAGDTVTNVMLDRQVFVARDIFQRTRTATILALRLRFKRLIVTG